MNRRIVLVVMALTCFALSLGAVLHNQHRLDKARAERIPDEEPQEPVSNEVSTEAARAPSGSAEKVTPEILRLRAEVTRLSMRKRELELAAGPASANKPGAGMAASNNVLPLPPGYIRKSKARFVGYSTPENTIESLLWGIENRDTNAVLRSFTEEVGEGIMMQELSSGSATQEFFKKINQLPGLLIRNQGREQEDTAVKVQVEIVPDMPAQGLELKLVDGEWKIATRF